MEEKNNNTLALLLIERYSKSLQRLNELREVSSTSSVDTIFSTITDAQEMEDSVRQIERDFKKVMQEYGGSSRLAYRDWFIKFCGQKWPLYFHISAPEEEIKLASIPRKFRAEYASNLASIGRTLDDITRSLAIVFGFENIDYETLLREYFTPEARGTNDVQYNRLVLPEIQALKADGLSLKEWGAVASILYDSKATTIQQTHGSFNSWVQEFLSFMGISFKPGSVPKLSNSRTISGGQKFAKFRRAINGIFSI